MRSGNRIILVIAGRLLQLLVVVARRCGNVGRHDGRQPGRGDWWSRWRRLRRMGGRLLRMRCQSTAVETRFLQLGGLRLVNGGRWRLDFSLFVLQVIHFRLTDDGIHAEHFAGVCSAKQRIHTIVLTLDVFTVMVNNRFTVRSFHYRYRIIWRRYLVSYIAFTIQMMMNFPGAWQRKESRIQLFKDKLREV